MFIKGAQIGSTQRIPDLLLLQHIQPLNHWFIGAVNEPLGDADSERSLGLDERYQSGSPSSLCRFLCRQPMLHKFRQKADMNQTAVLFLARDQTLTHPETQRREHA